MNFSNKNVLVTGASRGIGAATALTFARAGATVGLHFGHDHISAEAVLKKLPGEKHFLIQQDLAHKQAAEKITSAFLQHCGRIDVLVNNAGIAQLHPVFETDFAAWQNTWQQILRINLQAPAELCHAAAHSMKSSGGGRIINVSSRGAYRGEPEMPAYGASKAGLNSLTQSLAKALAPHGIYCTAVAPGFTETNMAQATLNDEGRKSLLSENPMNRFARPEEIAHAILFLASDEAAYCNGTVVDLNGASYLR